MSVGGDPGIEGKVRICSRLIAMCLTRGMGLIVGYLPCWVSKSVVRAASRLKDAGEHCSRAMGDVLVVVGGGGQDEDAASPRYKMAKSVLEVKCSKRVDHVVLMRSCRHHVHPK